MMQGTHAIWGIIAELARTSSIVETLNGGMNIDASPRVGLSGAVRCAVNVHLEPLFTLAQPPRKMRNQERTQISMCQA